MTNAVAGLFDLRRNASGYMGLRNGGATSYMNSVLQQLFMQPHIRQLILCGPEEAPDQRADSVFYQMQVLPLEWSLPCMTAAVHVAVLPAAKRRPFLHFSLPTIPVVLTVICPMPFVLNCPPYHSGSKHAPWLNLCLGLSECKRPCRTPCSEPLPFRYPCISQCTDAALLMPCSPSSGTWRWGRAKRCTRAASGVHSGTMTARPSTCGSPRTPTNSSLACRWGIWLLYLLQICGKAVLGRGVRGRVSVRHHGSQQQTCAG